MNGVLKTAVNQMTKGDVFVLAMALILLIILYSLFWRVSSHAGEYIHIVSNEHDVENISLLQNREVTIEGQLGDSEILIEGGRVRFVNSPCTNKLCIHQGWASLSGELIACLPNRISVSIEGQNNHFDTVNF